MALTLKSGLVDAYTVVEVPRLLGCRPERVLEWRESRGLREQGRDADSPLARLRLRLVVVTRSRLQRRKNTLFSHSHLSQFAVSVQKSTMVNGITREAVGLLKRRPFPVGKCLGFVCLQKKEVCTWKFLRKFVISLRNVGPAPILKSRRCLNFSTSSLFCHPRVGSGQLADSIQ